MEMPSPDLYLYDKSTALFALEVTSPYLPRVGEELYFDARDELELYLTVTEVTHNFSTRGTPADSGPVVIAKPRPRSVTAAQRLLVDPDLLTHWAEQLPDVKPEPIPMLVTVAAEYRQRHPDAFSSAT
ncbi:hypothetical protein ACFYTQ_33065 [Nocardia sp. NPDC004068]|uniref:hypothetical protein n=1 Tax=Nocardia sp. NPDC004068 TaxID=3364303 RepID=UPI0036C927AA